MNTRLTICGCRHGRDNKLLVWQLTTSDEANLDKTLPVDAVTTKLRQPWLLHALPVNALNFCSFAMCYDGMPQIGSLAKAVEGADVVKPILFAVPNAMDNGGVSRWTVVSIQHESHNRPD